MAAPVKPETTPAGSFGTAQAEAALLSLLSEQESADEGENMKDSESDENAESEAEEATPDEVKPEDEAQDDEEDQPESESDTDTPAEPKKYKVKADGEELEVTEEELKRGYSREAHWTKKMQALSQERQQFEQQQAAIQSEREVYATRLDELSKALEAQLVPSANIDWDALRRDDPLAFPEKWAEHQLAESRLAKVRAEQAAVQQKLAETAFETHRRFVEAERERLFEALPEWKDETVRTSEKAKLLEFAKATGFTEEDFNGVSDHRLVVVLRKAMLHDAAVKAASAKKVVVEQKIEKAKVARPGTGARPKVMTEFSKSAERLAKTGNIRHGRDAMAQLLAAEEAARRG